MLASFVVSLRPKEPATLAHSGRSLHGLFLELAQQADPVLAEWLRSPRPQKPFTVSPLVGHFERGEMGRVALPGQRYRARFTVLLDRVFDAVGEEMAQRHLTGQPVELDGQPFIIEHIAFAPRDRGCWIRSARWEELGQSRPPRSLTLQFDSPTAFKRGELALLFPLPHSVFRSLIESWQAFSPLPLKAGLLEWVDRHIAVSRFRLQSSAIHAGHYHLPGFKGFCTFHATDQEPRYLADLHRLADFALYAGVGMKTALGMGQARSVRNQQA